MAAILIYVDGIILNNLACNNRGVHIWIMNSFSKHNKTPKSVELLRVNLMRLLCIDSTHLPHDPKDLMTAICQSVA